MDYFEKFWSQNLFLIVQHWMLSYFSDYPDYNSRIYSSYGAEVKYEDGEEQKYRPQVT